MQKVILSLTAIILSVTMGAGIGGQANGAEQKQTKLQDGSGVNAAFVDADGDGVCDNYGTSRGNGNGYGDGTGTGVCDGTGAGAGNGGQRGAGNGNGYRGGR